MYHINILIGGGGMAHALLLKIPLTNNYKKN